ncbi:MULTISPECIES: haloacid dehalogenase-like hydrolase [Candidatus Ichthyocystis]|uniref:haloacid dehalogenase-like hydrolase n=1 Tax=Candidatus Ichthyocystis TaxID=2929841 RepID=UPI000A61237C|nr:MULTISPECIES: haloacid dehalogenase-like hydrolase [Ichthyocystis]
MKNKIAVVFDFDDTLTRDSTSRYLSLNGISPSIFWEEEVQQLIDQSWDFVLAWMYTIMKHRKTNNNLLTLDSLKSFSKSLDFFPGVKEIFGHIRSYVKKIDTENKIDVEFYIISSGIGTIVENCNICHEFTDIWTSNLFFNNDGVPLFIKNAVSSTEKTRYLFQIHKGFVGDNFKNRPLAVNDYVAEEERRIPFENIIFIGDGYTDIPCFSIVNKFGGTPICVYENHDEFYGRKTSSFIEEGRAINTVLADYSPSSQLYNLLFDSLYKITLLNS